MTKLLNPIHPGEILLEEFLKPYCLTRTALAEAIDVPVNRIGQICSGKREVTPDTAIRLGEFFETGPEFWMNLQANYNLRIAKRNLKKGFKITPVSKTHYVCVA